MSQWIVDPKLPLGEALDEWEAQATLGRKPRTVVYNRGLVRNMKLYWAADRS